MTASDGDTVAQVFTLPDLGEGLTEAEILDWLVAVGDDVAVDQAIVEVETAKATVEVPSPYSGRVAVLHGTAGEAIEVGSPLITIDATATDTDNAGTQRSDELHRQEEKAGSGNVLIGYGTTGDTSPGRRRRPRAAAGRAAPTPSSRREAIRVSSPLVRRLARDHGVDLAAVTPTGERGVIMRADVERTLAAREQTPTPRVSPAPARVGVPDAVRGERRTPLTPFRRTAAAVLARSRTEIPEATVWVDVDATALWDLRDGTRGSDSPGLLAYLARFVVAGLKRYPVLNARFDSERQEVVEYDHIDLGLAVQGERGLVAPAVLGAETMTTTQLGDAIRDLTSRAREGNATAQELAAGTFTLNNYGSLRVDGSAAIINHPQVAILGIGRIIDRPWVVDGDLCVRKVTQLSFVFDHRVCDGGAAAGFMRVVADAIENPAAAIRDL